MGIGTRSSIIADAAACEVMVKLFSGRVNPFHPFGYFGSIYIWINR